MITITKDDCTKMRKVVLSDGSVCHLAEWICPSPSGDTLYPVKCSNGQWYSPQGSGESCSPSILGFVEVEGAESARPPIPPDSITTSYRTKDGASFTDRTKAEDRARLLLEMESNGIECVGRLMLNPIYVDLSAYPESERSVVKSKIQDSLGTRG